MITFLDKETVLAFHQDHIDIYGGDYEIEDEDVLESVLQEAGASSDGMYVHKNLFGMASYYGYHFCLKRPFADGNKRTALISIYTFLYVNGYRLKADKKSLYAIITDLSKGKVEISELAAYLKEHSGKLK